jgi:hypothetical protein
MSSDDGRADSTNVSVHLHGYEESAKRFDHQLKMIMAMQADGDAQAFVS